MSNKLVFYFAIFISILWPFSSNAYELATHARITEKGYERSVLATDLTLLDGFGLSNDISPFGEEYYDISGSEVRTRRQNDFEKIFIPNTEEKLTIKGWLMRGAIREDDVCPFSPCDAPNNMIRVLNHFFDPVNNRPLTILGVLGAKATDWATGLQDTYANPALPDTTRANHFSLLDAREAMWRALTGMDRTGNADIGPGQAAATEAVRKAYWATTFRALGDVMHLVQDMSQPQQIRHATT